MKSLGPIRALYLVAGLYDGLLGLAFLVAAPAVFRDVGITPPNHWGYVHFSAGILLIFGIMFVMIARRPVENRNLIPYGVLLKVCYVTTVCWHWYFGGIPNLWKYFAAADTVFGIAFVCTLPCLAALARTSTTAAPLGSSTSV